MKKFLRVALTLIMCAISFSACTNPNTQETSSSQNGDISIEVNESGEIVGEENWFMFSENNFEAEFANPFMNTVINNFISVKDDSFTTLVTGYAMNLDATTRSDHDLQYEFCNLITYDYDGSQLLSVDLSDYHCFYTEDGVRLERRILGAIELDANYQIITTTLDYDHMSSSVDILSIDKVTGEIISSETSDALTEKLPTSTDVMEFATGDDKIVFCTHNFGAQDFINPRIVVYNVNGEVESCPLGVSLQAQGAEFINGIYKLDNTHFAITSYSDQQLPLVLVLDTDSMETELLDMEEATADLGADLSEINFSSPGNAFSNELALMWPKHLATFDSETMTFKEAFNSDYCNMNQFILRDGTGLIGTSNGSLVLAGFSMHGDYIFSIYKFDPCDGNPYEGRELLRASAIGRTIDYNEADIIYRFNDSQDEVFVAIDNSYSFDEETLSAAFTDPESYANTAAGITAQLAIDLMSGDGPDIIIGGFEFLELNNSECLVDLMPYLEEAGIMDNVDYYSNMFTVSRAEDGALYQVPLGVSIDGLSMPYSPSNSNGFTFAEYSNYVSNNWNGWDPLNLDTDQLTYFINCFDNMSDLFIHDGTVDLNNEEFYALAEFVRDNVYENVQYDDYVNSNPTGWFPGHEMYSAAPYTVIGCYQQSSSGYVTLYGVPSSDGRGPRLRAIDSIGVSTSCSNVDMAAEFVLFSLSEESQQLFELNSVRRDVIESGLYHFVDVHEMQNQSILLFDPSERVTTISPDSVPGALEVYSELADSLSGTTSGDTDIHVIIYEEMAPYFAGDKTLEEVIPIIEDRIQTLLNERG